MKDYSLYQKTYLEDKGFPLYVQYLSYADEGPVFYAHWHEQLEILYFYEGKGVIELDKKQIEVGPEDIVIVNSNELHSGYCMEKTLKYHYIAIDTSLIRCSVDGNCEQKYITPITQNHIMFTNKISGNPVAIECVKNIIAEYETKEAGFELSIKSYVYRLLVFLLRNHMDRILTQSEYKLHIQNLQMLNKILEFVESSYMEEITIDRITKIACLSRFYLSRLFKRLTGKSINEYINSIRIDKAEQLIKNTNLSMTEIAMATGFNDANYFSRIFKKYKNAAPSEVRRA